MNEIVKPGATQPVPVDTPTPRPLSEADLAALRRAVTALERPSLAARLSSAAGAPLDLIGNALPGPIMAIVTRSTEGAIRMALQVALASLPDKEVKATGTAVQTASEAGTWRLNRLFESSERKHKAMAALSGAIGGAFGLATVAAELPFSTTLMLRSIAAIAREEGEDLSTPEGALACMQVFALGGRSGADAALTESGYFAVRAALAKTMSAATSYAASQTLLDSSAPAFVRVVTQIAARFGIVVSQKLAAQAVPVIGAFGGAAVNTAFMDHFQSTARAHFTVRRLERTYGKETIRAAYDAEKAALGYA